MSFRRIIFVVAIFAFLISSSPFAGGLSDVPGKPAIPNLLAYVPNKIVVKFNPDLVSGMKKGLFSSGKTGLSVLDAIGSKHGAKLIKPQFPGAQKKMLQGRVIDLSGWHEIHFTGKLDVEEVVKEYKSFPGVIEAQPVSIHPVYAEPNDQFYYLQWHLPKIQAPQAWDIETGHSSITVAILDTGVRYFMQDLGGSGTSYYAPTQANGSMWINLAEKDGLPGVDDDGNGYVDDWIGWDFVASTDVDPSYPCTLGEDCDTPDNDPRDFNGHGTHCAGSLGAMNNNSEAVASVSGGWGNGALEMTGNGVKVMPLRIGWSADYLSLLEVGVVEMSYAAQALQYAADNGAKIASCSWGSENTGGIKDAIDYFLASGGLIFKAAGNDGADSPDYISSLSGGLYERIIKVAASDENDCIAYFSNFGSWVTLLAPGVGIYSCYHDHYDPETDYVAPMDGTSMAAPLAAGVAALIWSQNPTQSADEVKNRLVSSADSIDGVSCNSAYAGKLGAGRINAYRALSSKKERVDFDGDGKTDIAFYRSSTGVWWVTPSSGAPAYGYGWGGPAFAPVPGDFDGDRKTDIAIYDTTGGAWWIVPSSGAPAYGVGWGGSGFTAVHGDYDGDGKTDIAIYDTTGGAWWVIPSSGAPAYGVGWGGPAFAPVPGDYDGDGKTDIAIYDTTAGAWWIIPSSGIPVYGVGWGGSPFKPVPGDYDGDGKTDIAIYDTTRGAWWIIPSSGAPAYEVDWGGTGFTPVPGDYDGDGKTDVAIYQTSNGSWWILYSSGGGFHAGWGGDVSDIPLTTNPD